MTELTYLQAISDGLREEMRADPRVFLMGEDIGVFGGAFKVTDGFIDEFGAERVIDTPLAESAIVGTAIGAAVAGATTLIPGACMNHASGFWEWNGPPEKPPPDGSRTVIGTASPWR